MLRFSFPAPVSNRSRIDRLINVRVLPCCGCQGLLYSPDRAYRIQCLHRAQASCNVSPTFSNRTCTFAAPLCFFTLRRPSWTMRNKHNATSGCTERGTASVRKSTSMPCWIANSLHKAVTAGTKPQPLQRRGMQAVRKCMKISTDFAGKIQNIVHLLDSLIRRGAYRFFCILQFECHQSQPLAKIVMDL